MTDDQIKALWDRQQAQDPSLKKHSARARAAAPPPRPERPPSPHPRSRQKK